MRSLAGLIRNCGVLTKAEAGPPPDAYAMYRRRDAGPNSPEAQAFRAAYSREVTVRFIGVWDTVGALGIPLRGLSKLTAHRHEFHDVELSRYVKHACHALAIDERRGPFRPSLWRAQPKPGQIVEQVWFAGVHSDVGGSLDPALGQPTLEWMKERASSAGLVLEETAESPTGSRLVMPEPEGLLARLIAWLRLRWSRPRQIGGTGRDRCIRRPATATRAIRPGRRQTWQSTCPARRRASTEMTRHNIDAVAIRLREDGDEAATLWRQQLEALEKKIDATEKRPDKQITTVAT